MNASPRAALRRIAALLTRRAELATLTVRYGLTRTFVILTGTLLAVLAVVPRRAPKRPRP